MAVAKIDLPVIGPVSTTWVYVAGAGIAGIVVYAWWTGGGGGGADNAQPPDPTQLYDAYGNPVGVGVDEYVPPKAPPLGGEVSNTERPPVPITNSEWTLLATDHLSTLGFEPTAIAVALGKFLTRQRLTAQEATFVQSAVAAYGQPPQNGPWPIQTALPTPTPTPKPKRPPAPSSVTGRGGRARWSASWSAVPGATSYEVRLIRGYPAGSGYPWKGVKGTSTSGIVRPKNKATWTVEVRARNAAGAGPAKRSGPFSITP